MFVCAANPLPHFHELGIPLSSLKHDNFALEVTQVRVKSLQRHWGTFGVSDEGGPQAKAPGVGVPVSAWSQEGISPKAAGAEAGDGTEVLKF